MIEMQLVDSSSIKAIGYDLDSRELHVKFRLGELYVYFDVDEQVFQEFLAAESKGAYLNLVIKPLGYRFDRR